MPGPETQKETPKLSEAAARDKLKKVAGDTYLMNDDLIEELIAMSQSEDDYERFKFKYALVQMKRIKETMDRQHKYESSERERILNFMSAEERNAAEATTLLLSRENYQDILNQTDDTLSLYDEYAALIYDKYAALIYDKEEPADDLSKSLLASPEEMAKIVKKMPTKGAYKYLFQYRFHVKELARYTIAGVFDRTEAKEWAEKAKTKPESLEKEIKNRKKDYETREHAAADRYLAKEMEERAA